MHVSKRMLFAALFLGTAGQVATSAADELSYDYNAPIAARKTLPTANTQSESAEVVPSIAKKSGIVVKNGHSATRTNFVAEKPKAAPENILRSSPENILRPSVPEPALLEPNVTSTTRQIAASAPVAPKKANWPTSASQQATLSTNNQTASHAALREAIARPSAAALATDTVQEQRSSRNTVQQASTYSYASASQEGFSNGTTSVMQPEAIGAGTPVPGYSGFECNSCYSSDCCCDECASCINPCGCCGPFGGVEYLLIRPTFSENQAYLARTIVVAPDDRVTVTDNVVHNDYGYTSSVRAFFGYRCSCNEEIRFTYWNFGGDSLMESRTASQNGLDLSAGHLELVTRPGERLLVDNSLNMNVYDIDYSRCCCNPCSTCDCCPTWTLKYSAGVRIADVSRQDNTFVLNSNDAARQAAFISADFIGAGPRVGLEGRRFLGAGYTSIFAKTNFSLLLGQYDIAETRKSPPSEQALVENFFDSHARIIPVAEIELGGSWQLSETMTFSTGYLFQAWWDLGAFEQVEGNVFLSTIDDSNIMSFDGLFARLEICF